MLGFVVFIAQLCIIRSEFTIMQISDFHLDTKYSREGDPRKLCHLSNRLTDIPSNKLGVYGDYMCDSPMVDFSISSHNNHKIFSLWWKTPSTPQQIYFQILI
jgi:hypothetical protein